MTDTKTVTLSSLITLGIVTLSMIVPNFFDTPKYYCETRPELGLVKCDSFSKYVADNGRCIRNEDTNLICREGWLLVTDDTILPEEKETPKEIIRSNTIWGKQYVCSDNGCIEKF